jgi:rhamnosyltransferase
MQHEPPRRKIGRPDVCAIVVTFYPDAEFAARLRRISPQVGAVVIVDNGSGDIALAMLDELVLHPFVSLIRNGQNLGVARALNIGVERAASLGFTWTLLLDQDTVVAADMVEALASLYDSFPDGERLAIIGSGFTDAENHPIEASRGSGDDRWEEPWSVITSGSLLPLSAYAEIGPFREEFFVDYVDADYCLRARHKNYRVVKSRKTLMSHAIGNPTEHQLLWMKKKWTTNHSADRRYYIARNDTVLLREYGHYVCGLWAIKSLLRRVRACRRIILYEDAKADKILAIAQGWRDGVRGILGPRRVRRPPSNGATGHGRQVDSNGKSQPAVRR